MTSSPLPPLPPDAVLVHIGPHKTGTTAIQSTLADSRESLRELGIDHPGTGVGQHREAKALRQFRAGWKEDGRPPPDSAVWTQLAQRVRQTPGRVVISSEFLADADERARAQLVSDLGPERVHVLVAARNPAGIAVSTWQQLIRTYGRTAGLDDWLENNFRRTVVPDTVRGFWRRADPVNLVAQWTDTLPAARVTVVVLDEGARNLLPSTFEELLGLPSGMLADQSPRQSNRGLSAVEVALVRRINELVRSRLSWSDYTRTMRTGVIQRLIEVRRPATDEPRTRLPEWAIDQASVEAERTIAGLRGCGAQIAGDLASLRTMPTASGENQAVSHVPIDLAAEAVAGAIAVATRNSWSLDVPPPPLNLLQANRRVLALERQLAKARENAARARARRRPLAGIPAAWARRSARKVLRRLPLARK